MTLPYLFKPIRGLMVNIPGIIIEIVEDGVVVSVAAPAWYPASRPGAIMMRPDDLTVTEKRTDTPMKQHKYSIQEIDEMRELVVKIHREKTLTVFFGQIVSSTLPPEIAENKLRTYMQNGTTVQEFADELQSVVARNQEKFKDYFPASRVVGVPRE